MPSGTDSRDSIISDDDSDTDSSFDAIIHQPYINVSRRTAIIRLMEHNPEGYLPPGQSPLVQVAAKKSPEKTEPPKEPEQIPVGQHRFVHVNVMDTKSEEITSESPREPDPRGTFYMDRDEFDDLVDTLTSDEEEKAELLGLPKPIKKKK